MDSPAPPPQGGATQQQQQQQQQLPISDVTGDKKKKRKRKKKSNDAIEPPPSPLPVASSSNQMPNTLPQLPLDLDLQPMRMPQLPQLPALNQSEPNSAAAVVASLRHGRNPLIGWLRRPRPFDACLVTR